MASPELKQEETEQKATIEKFFGNLPLLDLGKGFEIITLDLYEGYLKVRKHISFGSKNEDLGMTTTREYVSLFYNPAGALIQKDRFEVDNLVASLTATFYYPQTKLEYRLLYTEKRASKLYLSIHPLAGDPHPFVASFTQKGLDKIRIPLLDVERKKPQDLGQPEALFTLDPELSKVKLWINPYHSKGFIDQDPGTYFLNKEISPYSFVVDLSEETVHLTGERNNNTLKFNIPKRINFTELENLMKESQDQDVVEIRTNLAQIPSRFPVSLEVK